MAALAMTFRFVDVLACMHTLWLDTCGAGVANLVAAPIKNVYGNQELSVGDDYQVDSLSAIDPRHSGGDAAKAEIFRQWRSGR